MTTEELAQIEARFQRASRRFEEAREERNAAVRAAVAAGMTHAQIATATGLTRSRVGQIAPRGIAPAIGDRVWFHTASSRGHLVRAFGVVTHLSGDSAVVAMEDRRRGNITIGFAELRRAAEPAQGPSSGN